jgi:hypothetical protein
MFWGGRPQGPTCYGMATLRVLHVLGWLLVGSHMFWGGHPQGPACFGVAALRVPHVLGWPPSGSRMFWGSCPQGPACFGVAALRVPHVLGWPPSGSRMFWGSRSQGAACFGVAALRVPVCFVLFLLVLATCLGAVVPGRHEADDALRRAADFPGVALKANSASGGRGPKGRVIIDRN